MLQLTPRTVAAPHRAKYLQIADAIRAAVADGYLHPGENLPSEADIAFSVGVSKGVVRQGLDVLVQEAVVQRRNGVPARVTPAGEMRTISPQRYLDEDARIAVGEPPAGSAFTDGHGIGWDQYSVEIEIRREVATPKDLAMLHLPPGSYVWRRYFLKSVDGEPVEIQRSALPEFVVDGNPWLIDPARQPAYGGTQRELADAGWRATEVVERHRARYPSENEKRDLRIAQIPVIDTERTFFRGDTAVEASRLVLPAPRHELVYTTTLV